MFASNSVTEALPVYKDKKQVKMPSWCGGENASAKKIFWSVLTGSVLITGIILLANSLQKLKSTEYGIQYNKHKKQLDDAVKSGGMFAGPPGYSFVKFPSTFITVDIANTCVSADGLRVNFEVTFQYQMVKENMLEAIMKYRNFDKWADIVEAAGESAVQHSCSEYDISNFQNQRGIIQAKMEDNLRLKLGGDPEDPEENGVLARAVSLQLRNLELPQEYQVAVTEKQSAEEDIALAKNQREQEITKAQTELYAANEQAQKILDAANNDAEVLLTESTLKAQETIYAYQMEAETIVDVKIRLNLTTEGILGYMSNKLYESAVNLTISSAEPAKISRADEL